MRKLNNIIIVLVLIFLMFFIVQAFLKKPNLLPVKGQIEKMNLASVDKMIIISHPGDESVFGGMHLISDKYLVVCISCGYDKEKTTAFLKAINYSDDYEIMMGYSDKIYFNKDYKKIKKQLKYILNYKDWQAVITHNQDGEYGNFHHKQINKNLNELDVDNLYYFGKYYSKKELDRLDMETKADGNLIKMKINMVKNYDNIYDDYKHILPFEDLIGADKWKS